MTSWVRLWHDMPTDPKFRTIARASKQPLPVVVSIFTFMLADASANETERGRTTATDEDIASAFDLDEQDVFAVRQAMQGRVLDGQLLAGWDKRQPKKEDNSAERAKAWRAAKQVEAEAERLRTPANACERPDAEADTDENQKEKIPPNPQGGEADELIEKILTGYPSSRHSRRGKAEAWLRKQSLATLRLIDKAVVTYSAWFWQAQKAKGREGAAAAEFAPGIQNWLADGGWQSVQDIPSVAAVEPMVKLDRERDEALWQACEAIMKKKAPTSDTTWSFRKSVVDQAQASIAQAGAA